MRSRILLAPPLLVLSLLALAACGSAPAKSAPSATATRPGIPADFGPAPTLGGNVTSITPAHAAQVSQASTRSVDPRNPRGLCAKVTFDGLPENAQWFRMAFDNKEVTTKLTWIITSQVDPKDGTLCYAPAEGFTVGKHTAALSVQDPRNPTAPTKQIVGWAFEVIP